MDITGDDKPYRYDEAMLGFSQQCIRIQQWLNKILLSTVIAAGFWGAFSAWSISSTGAISSTSTQLSQLENTIENLELNLGPGQLIGLFETPHAIKLNINIETKRYLKLILSRARLIPNQAQKTNILLASNLNDARSFAALHDMSITPTDNDHIYLLQRKSASP
ncbi:hypothetical protein [Poriferisphaera sp. WC338]|uniref:hypothetical protein n=1 Tax=Poriferisphaera sp. WC338 TaxID=3425129 RepID=UPI003D813050